MNRTEAQLSWAEIEQQGRNAEAARPMVQGAINHRYSLDIARENIDDYELALSPEAPGFAHVRDINKMIGADPRQMRLMGFNVVLDYQVSDWEIRKRAAPNPHPASETMTPEDKAEVVMASFARVGITVDTTAKALEMAGIITDIIKIARLEALEEAAKIADAHNIGDGYHNEAELIAAAIRERAKA